MRKATLNFKDREKKIYKYMCLFILNPGFISWLFVENMIQGLYNKISRNDTE